MAIEDTGWKKPLVTTQDGLPTGTIVPATGLEVQPCFMCRSFEKDNKRLMQHLRAHGLQPNAEGKYETPIARDIKGRRSLLIDPRDWGYCRQGCMPVDMRATCPDWKQVTLRDELAAKVRK